MKENVKKCLEDFQFEMGVGNFVAMGISGFGKSCTKAPILKEYGTTV